MDQIINLTLLVIFGMATVIALLGAINLLLPDLTQKIQQKLELSLGRSTLLGFVNFLFFGMLLALFVWLADTLNGLLAGIFVFLAGLLGLGIIVMAVLGLAAFANLLGNRIGSEPTQPVKTSLHGGLLLVLAGLAPYVGWLIFTPLVVWAGFGASIQSFLQRKDTAAPVEE